ncbi:MAG: class I SAM-dependent methyltransferase, partial [Nodosilinea sp.]
MFKAVVPGTSSRLTTVDHGETYGRHILEKVVRSRLVTTCVDLGCGHGHDLQIVLTQHPQATCFGVDYGDWNTPALLAAGIQPVSVNIEAEPLPLEPESVDLVIANQVLEHTKEIYWINHEIFRVLRVGGY